MKGKSRSVIIVALVTLSAVLVMLATTGEARAHTIPLSACDAVWQAAPPGEKWHAKQECLKKVKAHNLAHLCAKPRPIVRPFKIKTRMSDSTQRKNMTIALNANRTQPYRYRLAMVAAIIQESNAYNNPWGDGSSVGILQLIDEHGNVAWRMVIANSTGWFVRGAAKVDHGQAVGQLAQDVQRSGHPRAYFQWVPQARAIIVKFRGPCLR